MKDIYKDFWDNFNYELYIKYLNKKKGLEEIKTSDSIDDN